MASRMCLLNGQHKPGSDWERECPLRNAAERSERARRAAQTRYAARRHSLEQRGVSEHGRAAPDTVGARPMCRIAASGARPPSRSRPVGVPPS